jgi:GNAT superfamily N-acetyltransferase
VFAVEDPLNRLSMSSEGWRLSRMGADRGAQGAADVFSPVVTGFWHTAFSGEGVQSCDAAFTVAVNADLSEDRRVMVLRTADGAVKAVLTPSLAGTLGWSPAGNEPRPRSEADLRWALNAASIALHPPDNLFYFSRTEMRTLLGEETQPAVRRLSYADASQFTRFQSSASEQDLEDAYVELDHWAVFGAFEQDSLVAAASAYPWGGAQIADIGVLTLPAFRRRGHARAVVRALARHAAQHGHEPQYRCQLDNHASVAVAQTAKLTRYGTWQVVSRDPPGHAPGP